VKAEPRTPAGTELLDRRVVDPATAHIQLAELGRANALFGGHAAVRHGLSLVADALPRDRPVTVLDMGAGGGDVLASVAQTLAALGRRLHGTVLDHLPVATQQCRERGFEAVRGDWSSVPLAPRCADLVVASLVLHHLERDAVPSFLARLQRLARRAVIVADLRASRVAGLGLRVAGALLRFHPSTIDDGVISLRRGFTRRELVDLLARAGIRNAVVHRRPGWRIVAAWRVEA
jgi:SAM-dependent methyltransferase